MEYEVTTIFLIKSGEASKACCYVYQVEVVTESYAFMAKNFNNVT